jgi:hypothetical protein
MRSILLFILIWSAMPSMLHAETRGLDVSLAIFQDTFDFNYSGDIRETKFNGLAVAWTEPLAPTILGGIELGYLEISQYSNPIPAGQTGSGDFLGLNLSFLMIDTPRYRLLTRLGYRYSETRHTVEGQAVQLDWNQGLIELEGSMQYSENLTMTLSVGAIAIDGREDAQGDITASQPFRSDQTVLGHAGLKLGLDPDSYIGIQVDMGAMWGGQIIFGRFF